MQPNRELELASARALAQATAAELRRAIRSAQWTGPTAGLARGFVQANVVILPAAEAADFAEFCRLNPRACPLLEQTSPGDPVPRAAAPGADLRTDVPRYRIFRDGKPAAVFVHDLWLGSPARGFVDRSVPSAVLSDDPEWVQRYASLDSSRRVAPAAPNDLHRAYGATMGCFRGGDENYARRLLQCSAAQLIDRARETVRRIRHRPAIVRPKDFESVPPDEL